MSSSDRTRRWKSRLAAALLSTGLLSACGYHPLYAPPGEEAQGISADLQNVGISPIKDRIGQQLRNELIDRMHPKGEPSDPPYVLDVELEQARQKLALRTDETATRANLIVHARYVLHKIGQTAPVFEGSTRSVNSYNIITSDFANLVAEREARKRAARELGNEIATRLALYFNTLKQAK